MTFFMACQQHEFTSAKKFVFFRTAFCLAHLYQFLKSLYLGINPVISGVIYTPRGVLQLILPNQIESYHMIIIFVLYACFLSLTILTIWKSQLLYWLLFLSAFLYFSLCLSFSPHELVSSYHHEYHLSIYSFFFLAIGSKIHFKYDIKSLFILKSDIVPIWPLYLIMVACGLMYFSAFVNRVPHMSDWFLSNPLRVNLLVTGILVDYRPALWLAEFPKTLIVASIFICLFEALFLFALTSRKLWPFLGLVAVAFHVTTYIFTLVDFLNHHIWVFLVFIPENIVDYIIERLVRVWTLFQR